jgi:uncharacterized protein YjbJ (UPF0337 family)
MNNDRIKGTGTQAVDSVKDTAGEMQENASLQSEDKAEKTGGTIQTRVGDVRETSNKSVDSRL